MSQETQPLVYHSLSRHVQSIPTESEHLRVFNIYSSNQQPPMPSILQRSRTKKSHQKSLKKGLSRVSKSKQTIKIGQGLIKENEEQKFSSKGTLLNFNIQDVIQNKYHLAKSKDQIIEISPKRSQILSSNQIEENLPNSNQKSFISEYRIVTYVPSGRVLEERRDPSVRQEKESIKNFLGVEENWDKQNISNHSNVFRQNHQKNESESIQIVNPTEQNVLEQNTWRTSNDFDPYYSKNFGSQLNQGQQQLRQTEKQQLYSSLKPKYSVPLHNQVNNLRNSIVENGQLKDKIKHLEHEIVQIEREKNGLIRNYEQLKNENQILIEENQSNQNKAEKLRQRVFSLEEKIAFLEQQLTRPKDKSFTESYLFQDKTKQYQEKYKEMEQTLRSQIQTLQLNNAKISKELSEKCFLVTELNRKNKDLSEKVSELEKQVRKQKEKIESQQQKLYRKDEKINSLSLEIDRLSLAMKEIKEKNTRPQPTQYKSLEMDKSREEQIQTLLREELETVRQRNQQLSRDYSHLEKKHMFMKDELQHLKYLQVNAPSSLSHRSSTQAYNSLNPSNNLKEKQLQQQIYELETRLEIGERNLRQVEEEYSNLQQNFRALEELYIKQQDENYEIQQEVNKLSSENNKLKIELTNIEQIAKAKAIAMGESQSLRLMEKEEEILRLKKEFSHVERKCQEFEKELDFLRKQRDDSHKKYLEELDKNTQLTMRHKEDLQIYTRKMQKEEKQKLNIVVQKYEGLISKLNEQIQSRKQEILIVRESHLNQIKSIQQIHLKELTINEEEHKKEIETLLAEIDRWELKYKSELEKWAERENELLQSKNDTKQIAINIKQLNISRRMQSASKMSMFLNYETMSRKQLQSFTTQLQSDFTFLQNKFKTLILQKQRLQDNLQANIRQLNHFQHEIRLYKEQKDISLKEKFEMRQQMQQLNLMMLELKKTNASFEEQKLSFNNRISQLNQKYLSTVNDYEALIKELRETQNVLKDKELALENYSHDIRELRISLMEEKQIAEKKTKEIRLLKEEIQAHKSKQEYYKMIFQNTQRQLQQQLQQKAILLTTHAPKVPTPSPVKQTSPQKKSSPTQLKSRQTELYRIQIFKDMNKLLNLTNQHFTLQQILQKNEQQYLRKLYNAVKQDHDKIIELKQLIVDMEEGFKKQKVFIKEDYDVLYEKYLKYKNMCQDMNRDIERYKLKLKTHKDHHFANIDV